MIVNQEPNNVTPLLNDRRHSNNNIEIDCSIKCRVSCSIAIRDIVSIIKLLFRMHE